MAIDALGHRYGQLPNQVMTQATNWDLWVLERALTWHHQADREITGNRKTPSPELSQAQLQSMIDQVRQRHDNN